MKSIECRVRLDEADLARPVAQRVLAVPAAIGAVDIAELPLTMALTSTGASRRPLGGAGGTRETRGDTWVRSRHETRETVETVETGARVIGKIV